MAQYKPKLWHGLAVPDDHSTMPVIERVKFNPRSGKLDLGAGEVLTHQMVGKRPSTCYYLVRFTTETLWVQDRDLLFG